MTTRVYLSLGTNIGNRRENLTRAIEALSLALGRCVAQSTIIETEPWGFESSNKFLNCVAIFDTSLAPLELLNTTERIEQELGRTQKSKGGNYHDRVIDIDILLYGEETFKNDRLIIPHPLMHKRTFVLIPLSEIAPEIIHPTLGKSIEQVTKDLGNRDITKG